MKLWREALRFPIFVEKYVLLNFTASQIYFEIKRLHVEIQCELFVIARLSRPIMKGDTCQHKETPESQVRR